jgi:protein-tyrosine sulfotransferase
MLAADATLTEPTSGAGATAASQGDEMNVPASVATAGPGRARPGPVIVLTMARSGSTLLRFIMDSHPELGCPPETSLGSACFALARMWDLLEPAPEVARDDFRPRQVPARVSGAAADSIRSVLGDVYGRYLARRGKRRWCDKSLDNIGVADLLADLYPDAQFVCLYRHCLDVIVSAVEACPWGLGGYGFDQYLAASMGNSVAAVTMCWLERTRPIIQFQEKHPDRCHGIRYEDLVTDPEQVAGALFDFLGVQQVPGITAACLATEHDIRGPGDHKIWFTTSISRDSLGQGIRVPLAALPPDLLIQVNQTLAQLDYRLVDEHWPTAGPLDPRTPAGPAAATSTGEQGRADPEIAAAAEALSARLAAAAARPAELAVQWPAAASRQFTLLVGSAWRDGPTEGWAVSCLDSVLSVRDVAVPDPASVAIAATGATWLAILAGQVNLAAEMLAGRLRISHPDGEASANPHTQLLAVARLLGLGARRPATAMVLDLDLAGQPSGQRHLQRAGQQPVNAS